MYEENSELRKTKRHNFQMPEILQQSACIDLDNCTSQILPRYRDTNQIKISNLVHHTHAENTPQM